MEIVFAVVYIDTSCSKMLQVKRKQRGLPLNYPDRGVVPLVHITEVVVFTTCQICWGNWLAVHCHKVQGMIFWWPLLSLLLGDMEVEGVDYRSFVVDCYYIIMTYHLWLQWDSKHIYLVMEFCGGGDLSHFIRSKRALPERIVRKFLQQIGMINIM